jgi:hypothetical protein
MKTLDAKLGRIREGKYRPEDFIIADAKDGDMGGGRMAPGPARGAKGLQNKAQYLDAMVAMTESGLVDIMLMSLSSAEVLDDLGVFRKSDVTPAVRLNDASDIWGLRGATYRASPSTPFRSARLEFAEQVADLGLYSATFTNNVAQDMRTLEAYADFRADLASSDMLHFLEVFNPAYDIGLKGASMGEYVNDCIVRTLAGVSEEEAPLFLKLQYNGPAAMEELASYDPTRLIVGILGGGRGTTRDTFELAAQAEKYGARVALFGRKINLAESPLDLVRLMRAVISRETTGKDAVKAYHDCLAKLKITPDRPFKDDVMVTDPMLEG